MKKNSKYLLHCQCHIWLNYITKMADLTYFAAVIFLLLQLISSCVGFNCVKVHSCKCKLDDGTVIDLSPIGSTTGEARQV
jgi:hypothetical protein